MPERDRASMQVHAGIHVVDDALHGSDAIATSAALAKVLEGRGFDLIVFGSESTDARMSVVPAMVAERLGLPQVTFAQKVEIDGSSVRIERQADYGYDTVEASLPAVVSVVEKINEPRYPSFKGIMAAKKKPVETLAVSDLPHPTLLRPVPAPFDTLASCAGSAGSVAKCPCCTC